jgi:hypothetical protein
MAFPKFQTKEVLNKVLNSGEDALNVDLSDSVTVTVDSEFPAAAAITDNFANPTTTSAMSMLMGYDGSTWDRVTIGGGAEAAALRVTIASDSTGVVTVDDGGGALTVDGTVTANLSATDNAVLDAMVVDLAAMETLLTAANVDHAANEALLITIDEDTNAIKGHVDGIETLITSTNSKIDTFDAVLDNILTKNTEIDAVLDTIKTDTQEIEEAVETIEGAVSGSEMQVDVVASLPAGSAAIGKLAANSGVDIGDVDVTSVVPGYAATSLGKREDDAHSNLDVGVMSLAVRNDDVAAIGSADGDYAPLQVNAAGSLYTTDATGEAGSILVTGTTAVTTTVTANTIFTAIQFIEDTVFDSGNDGLISATNQLYPSTQYASTSVDADGGAVADSVTFPQGMTIFGRWSGFKLASGKVIAYIGYV